MFQRLRFLVDSAIAHQGFRRYFENTSWLFAEQLLRLVAGVFVGIWVARYLGPEQFGVFSYALAFAAIFSSIAKLGLDGFIVRDLVGEPNKRDVYLGTAFWLKLAGSFVTLAVIAIGIQFTSNDHNTNVYIFIIASGTIFQSFEVIDFYFQSIVLAKYVSICKMIQLILSSLLKIYFVITGADLIYFVVVSLIDQATLALTLYIAYRLQKFGNFYRQYDWMTAKILLGNSWPVILSGFVLMIQARIDQVMLKEMIGNAEVGYYSSAMRLIEVFGFVPVILTSSLYPAIVNARKASIKLYEDRLFNLYRLMMILFLIVALPIYLYGSQVVVFLYKEAYAPAGQLFSLMAIRLFFANYGVVRSAYLMTENLMTYSMITLLVGTLVNIMLNFLWIPTYHSIGAIWASITSFFVTTFVLDFFFYKTRDNCKMMIKSILLVRVK